MHSESLVSLADYARSARAKLPKPVLDYFEGGALDEITLRENTAGWERRKLYYRVLAGVGERKLGTTVLGQRIGMPICVAPTAFHKLACEEGEVATARAAREAGGIFFFNLFLDKTKGGGVCFPPGPERVLVLRFKEKKNNEKLGRTRGKGGRGGNQPA